MRIVFFTKTPPVGVEKFGRSRGRRPGLFRSFPSSPHPHAATPAHPAERAKSVGLRSAKGSRNLSETCPFCTFWAGLGSCAGHARDRAPALLIASSLPVPADPGGGLSVRQSRALIALCRLCDRRSSGPHEEAYSFLGAYAPMGQRRRYERSSRCASGGRQTLMLGFWPRSCVLTSPLLGAHGLI